MKNLVNIQSKKQQDFELMMKNLLNIQSKKWQTRIWADAEESTEYSIKETTTKIRAGHEKSTEIESKRQPPRIELIKMMNLPNSIETNKWQQQNNERTKIQWILIF